MFILSSIRNHKNSMQEIYMVNEEFLIFKHFKLKTIPSQQP